MGTHSAYDARASVHAHLFHCSSRILLVAQLAQQDGNACIKTGRARAKDRSEGFSLLTCTVTLPWVSASSAPCIMRSSSLRNLPKSNVDATSWKGQRKETVVAQWRSTRTSSPHGAP